jgi:hypothetical protein
VRHAGQDAIRRLEPLLVRLREREELKEKGPGTFHLRSKAFLHFHEDPAGLFADVRLDDADFARHRVSTRREQADLLRRIDAKLAQLPPPRGRRAGLP